MKKSGSIVLSEIRTYLKEYFSREETEKLYAMLEEAKNVKSDPYDIGSDNEEQINSEVRNGSSLRNQIDNLLTYAESRISTESYVKLCLSLTQLMIYSAEYDVAEDSIENLSHIELNLYPVLNAETLLLRAKIFWNQGEWKSSSSYCKKAYVVYSELENVIGMSKCENLLSNIAGEKGDIAKAKTHLNKAFEYIRYENVPELKAMITNNLGIIADMEGNLSEAKFQYNSALRYYDELDNAFQKARLNHNIGMLNSKQKQYKTAIEYFNESINISLQKGYLSNCAISFISKAYAYSELGEQPLSDAFAEKAMEISYKINDRLTIAEVYRVKGIIQKNLQNAKLAKEFLENSIRLNRDFKNKANVNEAVLEIAAI